MKHPGIGDPELPGDIPHHLWRHLGGILQKPAEIADGAELDGEPKPVRLPTPTSDQPLVSLIEEGRPRQLIVRERCREPAVVGLRSPRRPCRAAARASSTISAAVDGCRYVLHVASPCPATQPKDPDELIVPARDGALRVLRAALDGGIERVVLTSALAAIHSSRASTPETPYSEADWTDGADTSLTPYTRSKTIAEAAAWELARDAGADSQLATVNPGAIIGPVLGEHRSYSLQRPGRALGRRRPRARLDLLKREGPQHARLGATADRGLDRGLRRQPTGLSEARRSSAATGGLNLNGLDETAVTVRVIAVWR